MVTYNKLFFLLMNYYHLRSALKILVDHVRIK